MNMIENLKYNKMNNSFNFTYDNKEFIIDEIDFNFICCTLFRIQDEIEFQIKNHYNYSNMQLYETQKDNIHIYSETINGSIFLKINNIEINMSYKELLALNNILYGKLNIIYNINYDLRNFDPIYMSLFLWKRISKIKEIKIENEYLDNLYVPNGTSKKDKLEDTLFYKTLISNEKIFIPSKFKSNHVNENHYERIMKMLESIKEKGYPYNNQYIIVYDDEMLIRDGQHRACSLKYLYGNIEVPIMRIIF